MEQRQRTKPPVTMKSSRNNNANGYTKNRLLIFNLVINRFLRVLTPRQLGIITDRLIALDNGRASFEVGHCRLAFKHIITSSMDFHSKKDSAEILKPVEQASSINNLAESFLLTVVPIVVDLVVAVWSLQRLSSALRTCGLQSSSRTRHNRAGGSIKKKTRFESNVVYESVTNWQTVSYFNRVEYEQGCYADAVRGSIDAKRAYRRRLNFGNIVQPLNMTLDLLSASFLAIRKISSETASIGSYTTLVSYWATIMYPLKMIVSSYSNITSAFIDAERLLQLFRKKTSVSVQRNSYELNVCAGKVEFYDVRFSYSLEGKKVIKGINFEAIPGKTVVFVGETGAGKWTILKLIYRFYDVTGGSVMIDNQDLRDVSLKSLRNALSVVPQNPCPSINQFLRMFGT